MEEELFKILWMSKTTGTLKKFVFDSFTDDEQNGRSLFIDSRTDKVLTLFYHDVAWMITSPYNE
jgi:hypothetical protein